MGMFDYLLCEKPLPGTVPAWIGRDHDFQTKDTPAQYLETYVIREDGTFSDGEFTGEIDFYTSNICGSGPGIYTQRGEDAESVSFLAKVVDGRVIDLTQTAYQIQPALPSSQYCAPRVSPTPEQIAASKARDAESLLGRKLYVMYGTLRNEEPNGYAVEVIAENDRQLCVRLIAASDYAQVGDFELLDRQMRDSTFFDSESDAKADNKERTDDWDERKKVYDTYAEEWSRKRSA